MPASPKLPTNCHRRLTLVGHIHPPQPGSVATTFSAAPTFHHSRDHSSRQYQLNEDSVAVLGPSLPPDDRFARRVTACGTASRLLHE